MKLETESIKSSLSDGYILVIGNITVAANNNADVTF